jgi:hypothetical protein
MNLDASTIKDGGVVVLCIFVMIELRGIRPVLASIREVLSALLERDRIRGERKQSSTPPISMNSDFEGPEESTGITDIIQRQRRQRVVTPVRGVRSPRPGTHHDSED